MDDEILDARLDVLKPTQLAVYRILVRQREASVASLAELVRQSQRTVRSALRELASLELVRVQADTQDLRRTIWRTAC